MLTPWSKVRRAMRAFGRAREGNVATIFAISVIPILGMVGAAVDFSNANMVQTSFQLALDSTALMLSKEATTDTAAQLQANAQKYFSALFDHPNATNVAVNATYSTGTSSFVVVSGTASVPTTFMSVLGYKSISIGGSSTTKWGSTRLRVALVLDNTGSMAQSGKMTALKTATNNLLSQLQSAATNDGDVYVSIIPFTKDVNVGSANYSANWIDWDDWDSANGSSQKATTCSGSSKGGRSRCNMTWVPASHSTWNGCVTDRDKDYDQTVTLPNPADATLPVGQASTLFPAEQYSNCPVAMMGLNYNWTAMKSLVNSMQPHGNTNQPIGLVWGWQSLVGGGPLSVPPRDPNYQYSQIIILLTDGLNTQDRWYSQQTPIDNRMYQNGTGSGTCANIKAAGITIYTIQVNTGADPTSTLLQNCASDSSKSFLLTSANQIVTTFQTIGTNLTKLRLAK